MGLDIYVGSLTRYYLGNWENDVQRTSAENEAPVEVIRPEGDEDDIVTDPNEIQEAVSMWREAISLSLGENLESPLEWDERADAPYFTDRPTWECYASLLLWAAYTEHPDMERPDRPAEEWWEDPAYQRSTDEEFDSDFGALVRGSTLWFPCDFEFTFQCDDLSDETIVVGSTRQLSAQLFDLNARTWKADEKTIAEWRRNCPPADAPLELGARYAFSIMLDLARKATEQRLVMKLDY